MLTRETRFQLEIDPSVYDDPAELGYEALLFYGLFGRMIRAHLAGEPIPSAWQTALDAAREGNWSGGHDMLLAINAHVQRDMPFAVSQAGLVLPDGRSRKADHDRFNDELKRTYPVIVQAIGGRFGPVMLTVAEAGQAGVQQLVALWREDVWRNAERLQADPEGPIAGLTRESIELQARATVLLMKVGDTPSRRAAGDV